MERCNYWSDEHPIVQLYFSILISFSHSQPVLKSCGIHVCISKLKLISEDIITSCLTTQCVTSILYDFLKKEKENIIIQSE